LTAALPHGRPRAWALVAFLIFFVGVTTAFLTRFRPPPKEPGSSLLSLTQDIHTHVDYSLAVEGLYFGEELHSKTEIVGEGPENHHYEHRSEILIGESFPLDRWADDLKVWLKEAGATLERSAENGDTVFRVTYRPEGREESVLVEHVIVRTRPPPERLALQKSGGGPRAALVIDDLGQSRAHLRRLLELGFPVTLSVLPGQPHSRAIAEEAMEAGMELFLHLPMEPVGYPEKNPGPGALLAGMADVEMQRLLELGLLGVPGATGVNNHMGSLLTADAEAMGNLMLELREKNLLFLDSRTSPESLAFETAYRYNLPTTQRDVFLDAHDDEEFIRGQVRELFRIARKRGSAIGIGHPYSNTLDVLEEMRDEILASGIEWVTVSSLAVQAYRPGDETNDPPAGESR